MFFHKYNICFCAFCGTDFKETEGELPNGEELWEYYRIPVMCLLRIKDSVDTLEKNAGADGYFNFIESQFGPMIRDSEMQFSIEVPKM